MTAAHGHIPVTPCPYCGAAIECTSDVDESRSLPVDGDAMLCFHCTMVGFYVVTSMGASIRPATVKETDAFMASRGWYVDALKLFHQGVRAKDFTSGNAPAGLRLDRRTRRIIGRMDSQ